VHERGGGESVRKAIRGRKHKKRKYNENL